MHPAPSLIVFTTLSGLGFGLMVFLGLFGAHGAEAGSVPMIYSALALALAGIGLMASAAHLKRPERAWRAFSQWRSSWLSREGVLAVTTLIVFALYAALWSFGAGRPAGLGALAALLALATVGCTSMIYAQLRTVPR
ncbi:MAG: DmsC/YnfH family molybdoenzyme membrane anchor subunit, partial [Pseudomonadota bacterium]